MYTEEEARKKIIEAGLRLVNEKLAARTWGNISARISEEEFIITPSGRTYDSLEMQDLVKVKIKDLSYEGKIKPSSETRIHAGCYAIRKDVDFIIHTHQVYASVISVAGQNTDFAPCAGYGLPGTQSLWKKVKISVEENPFSNMFLLNRHGALCFGSDYENAFDNVIELEKKSRALFEANRVEAPERKKRKAFIDDYAQILGYGGIALPGEDENAVELIRSKNSLAACYTVNAKPMAFFDVVLQNNIYRKKYSKLADTNR